MSTFIQEYEFSLQQLIVSMHINEAEAKGTCILLKIYYIYVWENFLVFNNISLV